MADVSASSITLDALLAEFDRLAKSPDGAKGWTAQEILEQSGRSHHAVRNMLRAADKAGLLRHGKKPVRGINGVVTLRDCYWIEGAKPAKTTKRKAE